MRFNARLLTVNLKAWHGIKRTFTNYQLLTTILKNMLRSLKYLAQEEDRKWTSINSHKFCTSLSRKVTQKSYHKGYLQPRESNLSQLLPYSEKKRGFSGGWVKALNQPPERPLIPHWLQREHAGRSAPIDWSLSLSLYFSQLSSFWVKI